MRLGVRLVIALAIMLAGYVASRNGWTDPASTPPTETQREERSSVPAEEAVAPAVVERETPATETPAATTPSSPSKSKTPAKSQTPATTVRNVVIRDEQGGVVYRGDIDLAPRLRQIAKDERLRFRNDGSVFQNRERRLPKQASGYYREWVQPTPKLPGPGPQRIVTGEQGEVYYTPDHYKTFQRIE